MGESLASPIGSLLDDHLEAIARQLPADASFVDPGFHLDAVAGGRIPAQPLEGDLFTEAHRSSLPSTVHLCHGSCAEDFEEFVAAKA